MDQVQFDKRIARLEEALQAKLGVRGKTFARKLKRAGRLLPRHSRAAGRVLMEAQTKLAHPGLMRQIDPARVAASFKEIETHLKSVDPEERRKKRMLNWLGGTVANMLFVGAVVAAVIYWKDLI